MLLRSGRQVRNRSGGQSRTRTVSEDGCVLGCISFLEGDFVVRGDIFAAIRYFSSQPGNGIRRFVFSILAKTWHVCTRFFFGSSDAGGARPALVGEASYRTSLLYLAGSTVNFEDWHTGAAQVFFSKHR